jgi:SulP family sulfate permease
MLTYLTQPAPLDSAESARSVREETAELANYFLSDKKDARATPFIRRVRSASTHTARPTTELPGSEAAAGPTPPPAETITEVSEPPSPAATDEPAAGVDEGPSMLANMFRRSPPDKSYFYASKEGNAHGDGAPRVEESDDEGEDDDGLSRIATVEYRPLLARRNTPEDADEVSPLLAARSQESHERGYGARQHENGGQELDLEGQKKRQSGKKWLRRTANSMRKTGGRVAGILPVIGNPKRWNRHALWENVVVAPVACLPAVVVGLLLNILDALSYGKRLWCSACLSVC